MTTKTPMTDSTTIPPARNALIPNEETESTVAPRVR